MIYSNFPTAVSAIPTRGFMNAKIVLGDDTAYRNSIQILCRAGITVEKGLNPNLNFEFNKSAFLTIKKYEEDWRNFDDTSWNIPQHMFLMLTSNILDDKKAACKSGNGKLQTLERDSLSNFRMYARVYHSVGRDKFWTIGVYKVLTQKPCIVKITPPSPIPCRFLIIHDNQVSEYVEGTTELHAALNSLNTSFEDISKEDWVTL